jgi:hypothetical protein
MCAGNLQTTEGVMRFGIQLLIICFVAGAAQAGYQDLPVNPSGTHIRTSDRFFDVVPKIVPANAESSVELIPLFDHVRFKENCKYELSYTPVDQRAVKSGWAPNKKVPVTPENGRCTFKMFFEGEQEHILIIEEIAPDKRRTLCEVHLFSLEPDLLKLRPFKGDFHMHSNFSDGVESPAYVAGACRRAGLDFMALTDHRFYASSIEAQEKYKDVPIDLRIYPGEEVHGPGNPVHIVSFGAKAGISEFYQDEAAYRAEVNALEKTLPEMSEGVDRFQYASCVYLFNKIRELGGMGMFAHPYWMAGQSYYISEALRTYLFDQQPFDALELISGMGAGELYECDTNALQVARYQEERMKGKKIPICGISDTHGIEQSDTFGRNYTVCFAPSADLPDLIASIKDLNSVAVETFKGDLPRAYGPFRLVKYTLFLLREVFPRHDEMCFDEGRLMIAFTSGDKKAKKSLHRLQGQVGCYYGHLWPKDKK